MRRGRESDLVDRLLARLPRAVAPCNGEAACVPHRRCDRGGHQRRRDGMRPVVLRRVLDRLRGLLLECALDALRERRASRRLLLLGDSSSFARLICRAQHVALLRQSSKLRLERRHLARGRPARLLPCCCRPLLARGDLRPAIGAAAARRAALGTPRLLRAVWRKHAAVGGWPRSGLGGRIGRRRPGRRRRRCTSCRGAGGRGEGRCSVGRRGGVWRGGIRHGRRVGGGGLRGPRCGGHRCGGCLGGGGLRGRRRHA
mmetsp:Transcript_72223/g.197765  ORF Transcript_72223/g.197765 Transcript_72223/m.197765 type:complete len:257 (-) Transcript_72223:608-1378(-)